MSSKLKAAQTVTTSGGSVIIANGDDPDILTKIFAAEEVGTVFFPKGRLLARKRWLGFAVAVKGELTVDDGAASAILRRGKSLLPIGITAVSGKFAPGDFLAVKTQSGIEIARGMTNYDSESMGKILRQKSREIENILGECPYEEAIHRDNMQILLSENDVLA